MVISSRCHDRIVRDAVYLSNTCNEGLFTRPWEPNRMALDRDAAIQAISAFIGVGVFVAVMIVIGTQFNDQGLGGEGGLFLVGALVLFILVMAIIGYVLSLLGI